MNAIDELLREYKELEAEKTSQEQLMATDTVILRCEAEIKEKRAEMDRLLEELERRKHEYKMIIPIQDRQNEIKETIINRWNFEGKTYKNSIATVTLRVTKSLIVTSKKKIVDFLVKNEKIEEGVAKFDLRALRKYKEAGLIQDDAAKFDEKKNVQIKFKEGE